MPLSPLQFLSPLRLVNLQQLLHLAGDLIHDQPNNSQFFKLHTVCFFVINNQYLLWDFGPNVTKHFLKISAFAQSSGFILYCTNWIFFIWLIIECQNKSWMSVSMLRRTRVRGDFWPIGRMLSNFILVGHMAKISNWISENVRMGYKNQKAIHLCFLVECVLL